MRKVIGIDPSGVYKDKEGHIGIAVLIGTEGDDFKWEKFQINTFPEMTSQDLREELDKLPLVNGYNGSAIEEIIIEDYVLYEEKQKFQKYDSFMVSEVIG